MRIVIVSSWPPRHCGIATYSNELVKALRKLGNEVHIVTFSDGGKKKEKFVHPVIKVKKANITNPDWGTVLYDEVAKIEPDVVHIQHEYALYQYDKDYSSGLLPVLFKWRVEGKFPVVITYHSIYKVLSSIESIFMDVSLKLINKGIVHEEYQKIHLPMNIGRVPDNVYVIRHGAKDAKAYKNAKELYGLKGKIVVGMVGWWEPNKGFDRVIRLWAEIKKQVAKNAVLVLAGDARPGSVSGQHYKPELMKAIKNSKAAGSIKTIIGCFTPEEYDMVLSAFDVIVLPYARASQSGNLAHAFAMGIPAIVTATEGLNAEIEGSMAGIAVPKESQLELKHAVIRILKQHELRKNYAKNADKWVTNQIKWSLIAGKHLKTYRKMIKQLNEEEHIKK